MEPQIQVKYLGDLRTKAIHIKSNSNIITDAPVDNQGKGEKFSPTDLIASSLGSCMLTIMGISARTYRIDITGASANVTKIMSSNPRRIKEIYIDISFYKHINKKHRIILERSARSCPVSKSINPKINEVITFNYLSE